MEIHVHSMRYVLTYEEFDSNIVIGYRCINQKYREDFDDIQFFAKNEKYASRFGDHLVKRKILLDNAIFLEDWNIQLREKGAQDFGGQGLLTVHNNYLNPYNKDYEYKDSIQHEIYHFLGFNKLAEFVKAYRNADVIVGEDAGHPGEIVYAVRNKNAIIL